MNRFRAAKHEIKCKECRVTWSSWVKRILGVRSGYTPLYPGRHDFFWGFFFGVAASCLALSIAILFSAC